MPRLSNSTPKPRQLEAKIRELERKLYKVEVFLEFCVNHSDESQRIRRMLTILWKEEFETDPPKEKIKITPCCQSRHWHLVNRGDLPKGVIRCELCDRLHNYENLIIKIERIKK